MTRSHNLQQIRHPTLLHYEAECQTPSSRPFGCVTKVNLLDNRGAMGPLLGYRYEGGYTVLI